MFDLYNIIHILYSMNNIIYLPCSKKQKKNKEKSKELDIYLENFYQKIFKPSLNNKRVIELRELYYYLEDLDFEHKYELLQAVIEIIFKNNLKMPYNSPF